MGQTDFVERLGQRVTNLEMHFSKMFGMLQVFGKLIDLLISKGVMTHDEAKNLFKNKSTESAAGVNSRPENVASTSEVNAGHSLPQQSIHATEVHRDDSGEVAVG